MRPERFRYSAGKSARISLILLGGALLVGAAARPLCGAQRAATAPAVSVTPFTLKTQFRSYEPGDAATNLGNQLIARRADGTTVTLAYPSGKSAAQEYMRTIVDADGHRIDVLDKFHAITKWPANARFVAAVKGRLYASGQECLRTPGEFVAGHAALGGVSVVIVKQFPKGSSGITWWLAPELACQQLQETFTHVQVDGSFKLASETKFMSIKLGTPDAALFAVPKSYVTIQPSRALRLAAKQLGQKWNPDLQAQAEREDREYARLQQAAKSNH